MLIATGGTALLALTGAVACSDSEGPDEGADVEDITDDYFDNDEYVGQTVTVSAEVTDVIGPQSFELAGNDWGDESLLVTSADNADVQQGNVVEVTGEVAEAFVYDTYAADYALGDPGLYITYNEEKFLIADSINKDVPQE
ncbi:MAG: hypothetical protein WA944_22340 [Mycobacterium sp.]